MGNGKTNEQVAMEIAEDDSLYGDSDNNSKKDECYIAALEMARRKDMVLDGILDEVKSNILDSIRSVNSKEYYDTRGTDALSWVLRLMDEIIREKI